MTYIPEIQRLAKELNLQNLARGIIDLSTASPKRLEFLKDILSAELAIRKQNAIIKREKEAKLPNNQFIKAELNSGAVWQVEKLECGHRLIAGTWNDNYTLVDGTQKTKKRYKYHCYHRNRKLAACDGAYAYTADRVDAAVTDIIKQYLDRIKETPKDMALENRYRKQLQELQTRKKQLEREHEKIAKRVQTLTDEIGRALTGESKFDLDTLSVAIENARNELRRNEDESTECARMLAEQRDAIDSLDGKYDQFRSWAEEFEAAPLAVKKMIAGQLITRIELKKGYEMTIYFNPTYEQFLSHEPEKVFLAG